MIITLRDNDYNKLSFRFDTMDAAMAFVEMALDHSEGMTVLLEKDKEVDDEQENTSPGTDYSVL